MSRVLYSVRNPFGVSTTWNHLGKSDYWDWWHKDEDSDREAKTTPIVEKVLVEYAEVADFIEENIEYDEDKEVSEAAEDVYESYQLWALSKDQYPVSRGKFTKAVLSWRNEKMGVKKDFYNIRLK